MQLQQILLHLKNFIRREDGASGIEYALIAAMVAVVLVPFVPTISTKITALFTSISGALGA
ncbi:Flp family type IVb pilin [Pseudomonas sp. K1(2024)]|nr:Flp family type IVb pilin [Pseudomonas sp. K13]MDO7904282.1 Flp family type IVb pilin [Pseudomonas sp. K13]